jgi:hypothetical protein
MLGSNKVLIKNILFGKSILKVQKASPDISLSKIDELAHELNACFALVEVDVATESSQYNSVERSLAEADYKDINFVLSPTKTAYIDISKDADTIFQGFDRDIRRSILKNRDNNIYYQLTTDLDFFYSVLKDFSLVKHLFMSGKQDWLAKWQPFEAKMRLILAYKGTELLGGNMLIITPPYAYGIFIPTTKLGKKHNITASLIWEGIKQAKAANCVRFDLNGMYDARNNAPIQWLGLSKFKKKFRGREVEFLRPKVKVYSPYFKVLRKLGMLWLFVVNAN